MGLDWKKVSLFIVLSFVVLFTIQLFRLRNPFVAPPTTPLLSPLLQNDQAVKLLHSELSKLESRFEQKLAFHLEQLSLSINKVPPAPKPQPVPVKPDLERIKLKNFLKWLKRYEEYHNKVTSGEISKSSSEVKYVRCVGTNGFGNAFQSIISCFLYALVSNRVFLLSAETPFPMANYFAKPPIDYYAFHLIEGEKEHNINPEDLVCDHFSQHKKKLVYMLGAWGYDYFGQTIQTNPHYNLTETLPLNFYSLISDFLFTLKPHLQAKLDDFKKKHFGLHTIAIQIRATIPKTHSTGEWYKGKKDHEGHPIPPLSLFVQAAEMISHSNPKYRYEDINWYIVTQDTNIVKSLKKKFGKKIAFFEGKIITTFDEDEEGQETSFLTWWIAGECDDFITTEASSYGTTAAARAGVAPVVCNHGRWCARKLSPQPCQQVPYYGKEEGDYQIQSPECLKDKSRSWNSVESSCAFFEAIIRDDPRYERGDAW